VAIDRKNEYEHRRQRLNELLVSGLFAGKAPQASLAKVCGLDASYISRLLYPDGKTGKKVMGEMTMRNLEIALNLPRGWFDLPLGSPVPGEAKGRVAASLPAVAAHAPGDALPDGSIAIPEYRVKFGAGNGHTLEYDPVEEAEPAWYRLSWFRKHNINPAHVKRFRVHGNSMEPLLFHGDAILVNLAETHIADGKVYAIRYGDELKVKRITKRLDGSLVLISDNADYLPEAVPPELATEHITIIGRVRDKSGAGGL